MDENIPQSILKDTVESNHEESVNQSRNSENGIEAPMRKLRNWKMRARSMQRLEANLPENRSYQKREKEDLQENQDYKRKREASLPLSNLNLINHQVELSRQLCSEP